MIVGCEVAGGLLQYIVLAISQDFKLASIEEHVVLLLPHIELVQIIIFICYLLSYACIVRK